VIASHDSLVLFSFVGFFLSGNRFFDGKFSGQVRFNTQAACYQ